MYLKTTKTHRRGKSVSFSINEETTVMLNFDNFSVAEISETKGIDLIKKYPNDFTELQGDQINQYEKDVEEYKRRMKTLSQQTDREDATILYWKSKAETLSIENEQLKDEIKKCKELISDDSDEDYSKMSVQELRDLCKESNLPVEKWQKANKKELIILIQSVLNDNIQE